MSCSRWEHHTSYQSDNQFQSGGACGGGGRGPVVATVAGKVGGCGWWRWSYVVMQQVAESWWVGLSGLVWVRAGAAGGIDTVWS
jgi:hypothetical protein